jgi:hypothetical protein
MKVRNLESSRGNSIPNQFEIYDGGKLYFQSYDVIIAMKDVDGQVWLDEHYWDYSKTTSKYRNVFLRNTTKDCRDNIENGIYKLKNLN